MRKLGLSLALLAGAAAPVAAQQQWQPEVGLRAGWTRFDDPNSTTNIDVFDLPMSGGFSATANPGALYGIIPLHGRFALQPTLGFYNIAAGGTVTVITPGIRLNVALTSGLYVGAGATAYIFKQGGSEATQGGYEAAVGYRRPLSGRLRGSAEFFYEKREQDNTIPKLNSYGVRLGLGYALNGGMAGTRRSGRPAQESDRMWKRSIGLSGGWTLASFPNNTDATTFSLPFAGQMALGTMSAIPGPSALSMLFPMGEKMAFEPSLDYHRYKSTGSGASSFYQIGGRLNYAFNKTAYAAAALEFAGFSQTGASDKSRVTEMVGAGLRFALPAGLMGRTEVNYRVFDGNDILPSGQATSFVFGLMVPVK